MNARNFAILGTAILALALPLVAAETHNKTVRLNIANVPAEIAAFSFSGDTCGTANDLAIESSCGDLALTATVIVFDRNGETNELLGGSRNVQFSLCAPQANGAGQTTACTGASHVTMAAGHCTLADHSAGENGLASCTLTVTVNGGGIAASGVHTLKADISGFSSAVSDTVASITFLVYHNMQVVVDAGNAVGVGNELDLGNIADWVGISQPFVGAGGATQFYIANADAANFDVDFSLTDLTNSAAAANTVAASAFNLKRSATAGAYSAESTTCNATFGSESPVDYTETAWDYADGIATNRCLLFEMSLDALFNTALNNVQAAGAYTGTLGVNVVADTTSMYHRSQGAYSPSPSAPAFQELTDAIGSFALL